MTEFAQKILHVSRALSRAAQDFSKANTIRPFPIRAHARSYTRPKFHADLRAAINVALMAFPQGMAYALIAGLPIKYGIYCSALACIIGPLFASSRLTVLGPTNATAVLILTAFATLPPGVDRLGSLSTLIFLVGVFLAIGAFLHVADLTRYISRTVITGYLTGAGLLIAANQFHNVLGFSLPESTTFLHTCEATLMALPHTNPAAALLGVLTFLFWLGCRRKFPSFPSVAITLVAMSAAAHGLGVLGQPVEMLDPLPLGYWPFTPPDFHPQSIYGMISPAMAIALFAVMEGTFIAKSIATRVGDRIDSNQDMFSLGMANIGCSFFGGMAASASPTRSVLNWSSGAMTPFASILSGLLCAFVVIVFGPSIGYIPLPALAVVVICAAFDLIDVHRIRTSLRATRSDATVFLITLVAALLAPLDFAIYIGIASSIVLFLRKVSKTELAEYMFNTEGNLVEAASSERTHDAHISIIHVEGELFFGAADLFQDQIRTIASDSRIKVLILRMKNTRNLDATSVLALEELLRYVRETGRHLIISGATHQVGRILTRSGTMDLLGRENFFLTSPQNPNVSTRKALQRAQEILGSAAKPEVRIFHAVSTPASPDKPV